MQGPTRAQRNGGDQRGEERRVAAHGGGASLRGERASSRTFPRLRDVQTMIQLLEILGARVTFDKGRSHHRHRAAQAARGALRSGANDARVHLRSRAAGGRAPTGAREHARRVRVGSPSDRSPSDGARAPRREAHARPRLHQRDGAHASRERRSSSRSRASAPPGRRLMACVLAKGTHYDQERGSRARDHRAREGSRQRGAKIEGIGQTTMTIEGVEGMEPLRYRVMPDRIEAGTFAAAAAATGGKVRIDKCDPSHLESVIDVLQIDAARKSKPARTTFMSKDPNGSIRSTLSRASTLGFRRTCRRRSSRFSARRAGPAR